MLRLPGKLTAAEFLHRYWQKQPLFIEAGLPDNFPALTRNELAWLATLDDVESRIVFTERSADGCRYRAETGPFEEDFLRQLPRRDWTLLVHDVEKHLPELRPLLATADFIPDWRLDDLMVSFAAPGGSVGPHRDNYDVFLCQGIGVRRWHVETDVIAANPEASNELALLHEFSGTGQYDARRGDVLYLPPTAAHWGIATRACMTYSVGMRAPAAADLMLDGATEDSSVFYADPDLQLDESVPGLISDRAVERLLAIAGLACDKREAAAQALGEFATRCKDWLRPDGVGSPDAERMLELCSDGSALSVHGMAQIAYDARNVYVNGRSRRRPDASIAWLESVCRERRLDPRPVDEAPVRELLRWMIMSGAFEPPENL